jgi:hypothetical protein
MHAKMKCETFRMLNRLVLMVLVSACAAGAPGCMQVPPSSGGSVQPPQIDDDLPTDTSMPADSVDDSETVVFDITIQAASFDQFGIVIDATLTLVVGADGDTPFSDMTIADLVNDPEDDIGLAGGLFLTTKSASTTSETSRFVLSQADDGEYIAVFMDIGGDHLNRFILQTNSETFIPGAIGVTFRVETGSRITFRIDGNQIGGRIDLDGVPDNEPTSTDSLTGTFFGTRR